MASRARDVIDELLTHAGVGFTDGVFLEIRAHGGHQCVE